MIFTLLLIKQTFEKKINHQGERPKVARGFGLELLLISVTFNMQQCR